CPAMELMFTILGDLESSRRGISASVTALVP
ncbi:hypothetical protein Tco_0030189, partial [Tanacetum coccineum]